MRLQKHDFSDKDEKTQMSDAIFAMTNTLTAIDITISREKKNWDLSE
ncbi:MAG: hypothetical protein HOE82_05745 [Gammaproteobacteria bacterium]|nr:hypothetical protein [Gammaproteobacteria bacterium]